MVVARQERTDMDEPGLLFLIWRTLSSGPLAGAARSLEEEASKHGLLPTRVDFAGKIHQVPFAQHGSVHSHIPADALHHLLEKLVHQAGSISNGADGGIRVVSLTAPGKHGLLGTPEAPLPQWWRRPHVQASIPHKLLLRETGVGRGRLGMPGGVSGASATGLLCRQMRHLTTARGHRLAVYCCTYDNAGRRVITGSDDCLVKIWSAETGLLLKSCRGHDGEITDFAVSVDNRLLASGDMAHCIRIWSLQEETLGWPVSVLSGHTSSVSYLDFHPYLAVALLSCSTDGTCRIWNARDPAVPALVMRPNAAFGTAAAAAAAAAQAGGGDAAAGGPTGNLELVVGAGGNSGGSTDGGGGGGDGGVGGVEGAGNGMSVSPGGQRVLAGTSSRATSVDPVAAAGAGGGAGPSGGGGAGGGQAAAQAQLPAAHPANNPNRPPLGFMCCSWSPDGMFIFAGGSDCTVWAWHWDLSNPPREAGGANKRMDGPGGPNGTSGSNPQHFTQPQTQVQAGAQPQTGAQPQPEAPSPQTQPPQKGVVVAASSLLTEGQQGAVKSEDGYDKGQQRQQQQAVGGPASGNGCWGASESVQQAAPGSERHSTAVAAATNIGGPLPAVAAGATTSADGHCPAAGRTDCAGTAAGQQVEGAGARGSAAGVMGASTGRPGGGGVEALTAIWEEVREWPRPTELAQLCGHRNDIVFIECSHEGTAVATASRDGCVKIWRCERERDPRRLRFGWVWREAMSLTCPPTEEEIRKARLKRKPPPQPAINQVAWNLDDSRMVAAVTDNSVRVWDTRLGESVHILLHHTAQAHVLEAHPHDPRLVMSGGYDGRTILWDVVEGVPLKIFSTQDTFPGAGRWTDPIQLVDGHFASDGAQLALTDTAGQLHLYGLPVSAAAEAMARAPYDQFLAADYNGLMRDVNGWVLDEHSQQPPHLTSSQPLCDYTNHPYSLNVQAAYMARRMSDLPQPHPVDRNHPLPPALLSHPPTMMAAAWLATESGSSAAGIQQAMNRAYARHTQALEALSRPEDRRGNRRGPGAGVRNAAGAASAPGHAGGEPPQRRPLTGAAAASAAAAAVTAAAGIGPAALPRGVYLLIDDPTAPPPPPPPRRRLPYQDEDSSTAGEPSSDSDDGRGDADYEVITLGSGDDDDVAGRGGVDDSSTSDGGLVTSDSDPDAVVHLGSGDEDYGAGGSRRRTARRPLTRRQRSGDDAAGAGGRGPRRGSAGGSGSGVAAGEGSDGAPVLRRSSRREQSRAAQETEQQQQERIRRSARLSGHKRRYGDNGVDLLESYDTDDELYDEQLMDDGDMDSLGSVEEEVDDDDDSAEDDARRRQRRVAARRQRERERRAAAQQQRREQRERRNQQRREERERRRLAAAAAGGAASGALVSAAAAGAAEEEGGPEAVAAAEGLRQVARKRSHDAGGSRPRPLETYSWLQCTAYLPGFYCPQLGDDVVYVQAAHIAYLDATGNERALRPWQQLPELRPTEPCVITEISYEILRDGVFRTAANLRLRVDPSCDSPAAGGTFALQLLPPSPGQSEFLVPLPRFTRSVARSWRIGERCKTFLMTGGEGGQAAAPPNGGADGEWVSAVVVADHLEGLEGGGARGSLRLPGRQLHACEGLHGRYTVCWEGEDETTSLSPWSMLPLTASWEEEVRYARATAAAKADEIVAAAASAAAMAAGEGPSSASPPQLTTGATNAVTPAVLSLELNGGWAEEQATAARLALERLLAQERVYGLFFRCPAPTAAYPCGDGDRRPVPYNAIVPLPMSLELIEQRLEASFYRSLAAVRHDMDIIVSNAERFNGPDSALAQRARDMHLVFLTALTGGSVEDTLLFGPDVVIPRRRQPRGKKSATTAPSVAVTTTSGAAATATAAVSNGAAAGALLNMPVSAAAAVAPAAAASMVVTEGPEGIDGDARRPRRDLSRLWMHVTRDLEDEEAAVEEGGAVGQLGGSQLGAGGSAGQAATRTGSRAGGSRFSSDAVRGGADRAGGVSGPRRRGGLWAPPTDGEEREEEEVGGQEEEMGNLAGGEGRRSRTGMNRSGEMGGMRVGGGAEAGAEEGMAGAGRDGGAWWYARNTPQPSAGGRLAPHRQLIGHGAKQEQQPSWQQQQQQQEALQVRIGQRSNRILQQQQEQQPPPSAASELVTSRRGRPPLSSQQQQQLPQPALLDRPRRSRAASQRLTQLYNSGDADSDDADELLSDSSDEEKQHGEEDSGSDSDGRGSRRQRQRGGKSQRLRRQPARPQQPLRRSARARRQRARYGSDWEDGDDTGDNESDSGGEATGTGTGTATGGARSGTGRYQLRRGSGGSAATITPTSFPVSAVVATTTTEPREEEEEQQVLVTRHRLAAAGVNGGDANRPSMHMAQQALTTYAWGPGPRRQAPEAPLHRDASPDDGPDVSRFATARHAVQGAGSAAGRYSADTSQAVPEVEEAPVEMPVEGVAVNRAPSGRLRIKLRQTGSAGGPQQLPPIPPQSLRLPPLSGAPVSTARQQPSTRGVAAASAGVAAGRGGANSRGDAAGEAVAGSGGVGADREGTYGLRRIARAGSSGAPVVLPPAATGGRSRRAAAVAAAAMVAAAATRGDSDDEDYVDDDADGDEHGGTLICPPLPQRQARLRGRQSGRHSLPDAANPLGGRFLDQGYVLAAAAAAERIEDGTGMGGAVANEPLMPMGGMGDIAAAMFRQQQHQHRQLLSGAHQLLPVHDAAVYHDHIGSLQGIRMPHDDGLGASAAAAWLSGPYAALPPQPHEMAQVPYDTGAYGAQDVAAGWTSAGMLYDEQQPHHQHRPGPSLALPYHTQRELAGLSWPVGPMAGWAGADEGVGGFSGGGGEMGGLGGHHQMDWAMDGGRPPRGERRRG